MKLANTSPDDEIEQTTAPLIEHLAELRTRLIWSVLTFIVAMVIAYGFWNPIYNFLTRPICHALEARNQECGLILLKPQEGFLVAIRISFFGGFIMSFPIIAYQMWRFVAGPGASETGFFPIFLY